MTHDTVATLPGDTASRRTEFGPLLWGRRGNGIDIEPSCRMYGIRLGTLFLGVLHKDQPTASSSSVVRYQAEAKHPSGPQLVAGQGMLNLWEEDSHE